MFQRQGVESLLKEGGRHFSGEESRLSNIEAVTKFKTMLETSLGPDSAQKLIVSHIDKMYVTSDCSTIIEQLEIQHPAVKILILAAAKQAAEFSDQSNFVMIFAGQLLEGAGDLIKEGVHVTDIIRGVELARDFALNELENLTVWKSEDMSDKKVLSTVARSALSSKCGDVDVFSELVGEAAAMSHGTGEMIRAERIRTCKIPGGHALDSHVIGGMVIMREMLTTRKLAKADDCIEGIRALVMSCDLQHKQTDTTGNLLITDPDKLDNFTKEENDSMEMFIKECRDVGVEFVVVGGHVSDAAIEFLNHYGMCCLKVSSRYELRRICKALNCPAMAKMLVPNKEEIGIAAAVQEIEVGGIMVTQIEAIDSKVSTIVIRGASAASMDEVERAVQDAAGVVQAASKDGRFILGGGEADVDLSLRTSRYAEGLKGLEQYSAKVFSESLLVVATNLAKHQGVRNPIFDKEFFPSFVMPESGPGATVLTHQQGRSYAIRFSTQAAIDVLSVAHIIMARPAGGPKFPNQGHWDAQDDKAPMDSGY